MSPLATLVAVPEPADEPLLFRNQFEGCVVGRRVGCGCLDPKRWALGVPLHLEEQDRAGRPWSRLLELVDAAAADGRAVFAPAQDLGAEDWSQIVTLPRSIATLKRVKHLQLYGSNLLRIPPEIGEMEALEIFTPYTSYGLHWFPYEITRCTHLVDSTVSTRAVYGNRKTRLPFPKLPAGADQVVPTVCSVCRGPFGERGPMQRWITLRVATDDLPLLVHACQAACLEQLPRTGDHRSRPHVGGR